MSLSLEEIKQQAYNNYVNRSTYRRNQDRTNIEDGKIYQLISTMIDSISASLTGAGGSGEENTASNIGAGDGLFAQKVGVDLEFKSLIAGDNIDITPSASALSISASAPSSTGEANTMSNTGTGEGTVFKAKDGDDFVLKSLSAGDNVTITNNINEIVISAVSVAAVAVNYYIFTPNSVPLDIYNFTLNLGTYLI